MNKCEDCGLDNPPDNHECAEYEARLKAERDIMSTQEIIKEFVKFFLFFFLFFFFIHIILFLDHFLK